MFLSKALAKAGPQAVAALLVLSLASSAAFGETFEGKTVKWVLGKSRVVAPGQTTLTSQGELTLGYVLEATAASKDAPIKNAVFRATLSAFSPAQDITGQRPGTWYVNGTWEIIDKNAAKAKLKVKHNDAVIKGRLRSELDFNPVENRGDLAAATELPMTCFGENWGKGRGSFHVKKKSLGEFTLTIERWQKVK